MSTPSEAARQAEQKIEWLVSHNLSGGLSEKVQEVIQAVIDQACAERDEELNRICTVLNDGLGRDKDDIQPAHLAVVATNAIATARDQIAALTRDKERHIRLITEARDALAASFRVLATTDPQNIAKLESALTEAGVKDGIGVRLQDAIARRGEG